MKLRDFAMTSAFFVTLAGVAGAQTADGYAFEDLDVDGNGMVSEAELQTVMEEAGSDVDAGEIVAAQDTDGDGMISMEEAGSDGRIYETVDEDDD